jgi:adenylate cyclase class 2
MNVEVEIRVKVNNLSQAENALKEKFSLIGEKHQVDYYFQHPVKDFTKKENNPREYLRIRVNPNASSLEFHQAILKGQERIHTNEFECNISEAEKMKEILERLDFKLWITVDKTRKEFDCGEFIVCLDSIKGLGEFIEVESKKTDGNPEKIMKECYNFLKELKIEFEKAPDMGYPDMIAEKN